uniref:Uncharacterized protein n=1 Tax=Arundo donax TaxID=35708 RepID=A0A0A9ANW6_ARUDO
MKARLVHHNPAPKKKTLKMCPLPCYCKSFPRHNDVSITRAH